MVEEEEEEEEDEDEDEEGAWSLNIHIQSKSTTTFIQPKRQVQKSARSMERFKNLLAEGGAAFGTSNTASPRSGFGSASSSKVKKKKNLNRKGGLSLIPL